MRPLDTGMLEGSPPKCVRGPRTRVGQNSPCLSKSKVLGWHAWAWCLLMPLLVQMQLVFATNPSEAIDFVLSKYDHARSPGNHGRTQFGQGQDHGLLKHVDALEEGDTAENYSKALQKGSFAEDNTQSQNGRQIKLMNERTASNKDSLNVPDELVESSNEFNLDSRAQRLSEEVRETEVRPMEEKRQMSRNFITVNKAGESGKIKTFSQDKKLAEKANKEAKTVKKASHKSSSKVRTAREGSRPRRDVMGLPSPPPPMSMPGLILAHGYPAEVHHVMTEDGYILEVHRIPGPRMLDTSPKKRRRNSRRVGRGKRDVTQSYDPNDVLAALERENNDNWIQAEDVENLQQSNDIVNDRPRRRNLKRPETVLEEINDHFENTPILLNEDEDISTTIGMSEILSRTKRSEAQQNMRQRRQMIRTIHPSTLLNMARNGRSFDSLFRRRPQATGRHSQRSNRRSYQRPRRRSHSESDLRRTMRNRSNALPRENSVNSEKKRKNIPAGAVSVSENCLVPGKCCNNFTAKCTNGLLNSEAARTARQIVPFRNSKLNENNSAVGESDLINGELNEIDSDNFGKNSSSSENRNKGGKPSSGAKKVVFIQHCLQCSSADFVLNDHNQALAFILADEGYDVWLGNFRGNRYSRSHVSLSPRNIKYWQFTVDDLAKYDLPAMVNHVLAKTHSDKLFYIGHSLGTMTFFMASSTNADFLSKIKLMVALAPSGYIDHMSGGLKLMVKGAQTFYGLMETIGIGEVGAVMPWRGGLMSRFCKPESPFAGLCSAFLPAMSGSNNGLHDMEYLPSMLSNLPAGTSFRLMAQIGQIIGANGIRKFDYGVEENLRRYGTRTPPHYKLEKITCPVAIMWSQNDIIVQPVDVAKTIRRLPNVIMNYKVPHPTFNHVDFLFADVARELVYEPIVKLFASYA